MLILEYLGYVALYGYIVFGMFYIVSLLYPIQSSQTLDNIEHYRISSLKDSKRRELRLFFDEKGIFILD